LLGKRYRNDGIPILQLNSIQIKIKKNIESKIKKGIYKFEKVSCCICNTSDFELLSGKDRYGIYNPVVICKNCGLIQNNPRMNQDSYNTFYNEEFRKLYFSEAKPSNEAFKSEYSRGKKILKYLKESGILKEDKELSIFEVGCGSGGVLEVFKKAGFTVAGCDLDKEYLRYGKKRFNLDLEYGIVQDISFEKVPDIIIYSHVLEHILEPKEEIAHIHKIMNTRGYLYIEIPGVKNLLNTHEKNFLFYLQIPHVYHFSLITLNNLLSLNGFKLIKGNNFVRTIFRKSENSELKIMIKNDYNKAMQYLHWLEKSRKLLVFFKIKKKTTRYIKYGPKNYKNIKLLPRMIMDLIKRL